MDTMSMTSSAGEHFLENRVAQWRHSDDVIGLGQVRRLLPQALRLGLLLDDHRQPLVHAEQGPRGVEHPEGRSARPRRRGAVADRAVDGLDERVRDPLVALVGPLRADVVEDDRVEAALKGGKGGRKRDLGVVLVVHNVRVDKYY